MENGIVKRARVRERGSERTKRASERARSFSRRESEVKIIRESTVERTAAAPPRLCFINEVTKCLNNDNEPIGPERPLRNAAMAIAYGRVRPVVSRDHPRCADV